MFDSILERLHSNAVTALRLLREKIIWSITQDHTLVKLHLSVNIVLKILQGRIIFSKINEELLVFFNFRKEHLNNHEKQHTNTSPHKCLYCSKSFTRKEHLSNHTSAIHLG